tara:strand:+ start:2135 stop:2308 length:174 start_codon:yes stop_codon:yes gene_type:complete
MKTFKSAQIIEHKDSKEKNTKAINKGITRALLDKYKPKIDITFEEHMSEKQEKKRAA